MVSNARLGDVGGSLSLPVPRDDRDLVATDLLHRWMDVLTVQNGRGSSFLAAELAEHVRELDDWMEESGRGMAITACEADLRRYVDHLADSGGGEPDLHLPLTAMQEFYAYLRNIGFRQDDPASFLVLPTAKAACG